MSTAASAERPEGAGLLAWLAHREVPIFIAIFVIRTLDTLFMFWGKHINFVLYLPMNLLFPTMIVAIAVHTGRLCAVCQGLMPANVTQLAQRFLLCLWFIHALVNLYLRNKLQAFLVFSALMLFPYAVGMLIPEGGGEEMALRVVVLLVLMFITVSTVAHRRLQFGCPWCRDGGGGTHEHSPTPDPSIVKVA